MADVADAKGESSSSAAGGIKAYSVGAPVPKGTRRLHLNEFRYAHSPKVLAALRTAVTEIDSDTLLTHYPSGADEALVGRLANYVGNGATSANLIVAAGSDEVLRAVIDTCGIRGHNKLLMGVPGYTHFEHYARLRGLEIVSYSIVGPSICLTHDEHLASLLYYDYLLADGCLVYLCSPNNPTGDVWSKESVDKLARKYPKSFFLLDEAYIEFISVETSAGSVQTCRADYASEARDEAIAGAMNDASVTPIALSLPNVVVARTMSKAFGLASLRVGYAIANAKTIAALQVAVSPKAFGPIAARVACAALDDLGHYLRTTWETRQQTTLAVRALKKLGWTCADGRGNFFLVYVGDPTAISEKLAKHGVQVRNRDDLPGLSGLIRVTAGTGEDTSAVISAFETLTKPSVPPIQSFYTPKNIMASIKTLTRSVVRVLEESKTEFWAQGGTMLGIVRHRGIMQWDDDCDLAYRRGSAGEDAVGMLKGAFADKGLTLQRNRTDAYWQVGTNDPGRSISPVHIDIFSYSLVGSGASACYLLDDPRFREEDPASQRAHCNTKYTSDELFPLRTVSFYDYSMRIPHRSEDVLARALGPDYMTVAKIRTEDAEGGSHASYEIRDLSPA